MDRPIQRGITLAELIVGIGIVSLLLGALSLGPRGPESLESTQVAEQVAEELRALRTRAQRLQMPTALVLPLNSNRVSTGYFTLEGYTAPHVSRGALFSGEMEQAFVIPGTWSSGSSFHLDSVDPELDLSTWASAYSGELIIAFAPSGRLVTNMPLWLDKTHILFSNNAIVGTQSVGGRNFPSVTAAAKLTTVSIHKDGLVSISDGSPDGSNLPSLSSQGDRGPLVSLPPASPPSAGNAPVADPVSYFPPRSPGLPADIDASVKVGDYLRLETNATDQDGGPLYIRWTATRLTGAGGNGTFSSSGRTRMVWENGKWKSIWEWTPPTDISAGGVDDFALVYEIDDPEGNLITGSLTSSSGKVQARKDGKILFDTQRFPGERAIMEAGTDGTNVKRISPAGVNTVFPEASPYGDCIAYCSYQAGLFIANRDGSGQVNVVDTSTLPKTIAITSCWSPDGSSLAFTTREQNILDPLATVLEDVYVAKADGTGLRRIAADIPVNHQQPSHMSWGYWGASFDASNLSDQFLLFNQSDDNTGTNQTILFTLDEIDSANRVLADTGGLPILAAQLNRDGDQVVALELPLYEIVVFDVDKPNQRFVKSSSTGITAAIAPCFSFDSQRITYSLVEPGGFQVYTADVNGNNRKAVSGSTMQDQGATWLVGGGLY